VHIDWVPNFLDLEIARSALRLLTVLKRGPSSLMAKAMCGSKTLFNLEPPVTDEEIRAASAHFARKISGFNKPSKANEHLF
jgi:hypothetical protein